MGPERGVLHRMKRVKENAVTAATTDYEKIIMPNDWLKYWPGGRLR